MSVQAMSWAIEQQIVRDAPARHVLLCLANYADKDGKTAFPSASTLSADTGLSERTIRTKLDLLEHAGLIAKGNQRVVAAHIDRADRRPICYDLCMVRPASGAPRDLERGAAHDTTGCSSRTNGVQLVPERGARAAPNPSSKPSNKPPNNRKADCVFDARNYLRDLGVSPEVSEDWLALRNKQRAPATMTAIDAIAREAQKATMSLADALRECCARGWRGFKASWVGAGIRNAGNAGAGQYADRRANTIAGLTGRSTAQQQEGTDVFTVNV